MAARGTEKAAPRRASGDAGKFDRMARQRDHLPVPPCRCPKAAGRCENCGLLPRGRELGCLCVRCRGRLCGRPRSCAVGRGADVALFAFRRGTSLPSTGSYAGRRPPQGYIHCGQLRQGRGRSIAIGSKVDGCDRSGVARDSPRRADGMRFSVNGEVDGAVRVAEVFAVVAPLRLLANGGVALCHLGSWWVLG